MYDLILLAVKQKRERIEEEREKFLMMERARGVAARKARDAISVQRREKRPYQNASSRLSSPPSSYLTSTVPLDTEA